MLGMQISTTGYRGHLTERRKKGRIVLQKLQRFRNEVWSLFTLLTDKISVKQGVQEKYGQLLETKGRE